MANMFNSSWVPAWSAINFPLAKGASLYSRLLLPYVERGIAVAVPLRRRLCTLQVTPGYKQLVKFDNPLDTVRVCKLLTS